MSDDSARKVIAVAEEIRRHLAVCPQAADTLQGILNWWLPSERHRESPTVVMRALELLVADRVLAETVRADGKVIYSLASAAQRERGPKGKD